MYNDLKLDISELVKENMEFHEVVVKKDGDKSPVLMMIQDVSPQMISHILRLYRLRNENGGFIVDEEIESFAFSSREIAVSFANRLVNMTAIDLILIMAENYLPEPTHELQ